MILLVLLIVCFAFYRRVRRKITLSTVVVDSDKEVGDNQDYRLTRDPDHIIRVKQSWPEGIKYAISKVGPYRYGIPVAGVSHEPAKTTSRAFLLGSCREVRLTRDSANKDDPNAIAVIGHWKDKGGDAKSGRIGWVPKEIAEEMAKNHPKAPLTAKLEMLYLPRPGKNMGIRISLGIPKVKRKRTSKSEEDQASPSARDL